MPYTSIYAGKSSVKVPNSSKDNPFADDFKPGQYLAKNQPAQPSNQQPSQPSQPKAQPAPKPSLFSKVVKVGKSVANSATQGEQKFATGIARVLPGGTNDLKAEERASESAANNTQQVKQMIKSGKINAQAGAKIIKINAGASDQAAKETSDIVKKMPTKKEIALGAASTAADLVTAGSLPELKAAKGASLTAKVVRGGEQAAAFGTAGGLNTAAAGGNKKQIAENFVAGAAFPSLLHFAGKGVTKAAGAITDKIKGPPEIVGKVNPEKVAQGVHSADMKSTPTATISIAADDVHKVDAAKVNQYVKQIKDGEPIEPIVTHQVDGQTFVVDGQQRLAAAQKLGIKEVPTVEKTPGKVDVNAEPTPAAPTTKAPVADTNPAVAPTKAAGGVPAEGSMPKAAEATPTAEAQQPANGMKPGEAHPGGPGQPTSKLSDLAVEHKVGPGTVTFRKGEQVYSKDYAKLSPEEKFVSKHSDLSSSIDSLKSHLSELDKENLKAGGKPAAQRAKLHDYYDGLVKERQQLESKYKKATTPAKISNAKQVEQKANGQEPTNVEYTGEKEPPIPQIRTTKLAQGVEANAVKKGLADGFEGKSEYVGVNVEQQTKAAVDLVKSDANRAVRIALGQERPPEGLLPESVFIAVENAATKAGDSELLRKLATESHLTAEASGMGQRIRMLGEREGTSPTAAIQKVQKARADAFEKRSGKTVTQAVDEELKKIKADKAPVTKESWGSFVDSLKC